MEHKIKNLEKAAKRIKKAISKKEKMILYGDSDLDGATSVLILEETIKNLAKKVSPIYFGDKQDKPSHSREAQKTNYLGVYFPDWEVEDYGLNGLALEVLKEHAPALIILLDCGIGNFKELKQAKAMGFEAIVVDHHEILGQVPSGAIIVDPKQAGDKHPFKKLTAVSLVYELCCLLQEGKSNELNQSFVELAALGTVADMMPEEGTNGFVVSSGISSIKSTVRPGLKAVIETAINDDIDARAIFQKLVAVLNISNVESHLTQSYELLKEPDYKKAKILAKELLLASEKRSRDIYEIVGDIAENVDGDGMTMIFEGSPDWMQVLTGSIASRLCNKFKKPAFIFKTKSFKSKGSVRTPKGIDAVEALRFCDRYLEMYGGHPPAAGFTIKNDNLEKFKECLTEYLKNTPA